MKKSIFLLAVAILSMSCTSRQYDVCVYGGTASGVIAAYSAAKMGARVILVGPDVTIGGMTTGGLGLTDIGNKQAISGVSRQFYRKLGEHYGTLEQWAFEPSAAETILEGYVKEGGFKLVRGEYLESVIKEGTVIKSIVCSGKLYSAKQFIDCSYEGDLMAKAGVSYRVGREDNSEYGETYDGSQMMDRHQFPDGISPFKDPADSTSGLLWGISDWALKPDGTGDDYVQAYNYRICLTNDPANRIPISQPDNYDPSMYDILPRLFEAMPDKRSLNDWFIWSLMPNNKTDINNRGAFSTDMIGMNHAYPEASWKERVQILKAHKDYTLGLLYFYGHDERVPQELRTQMLEWGLPKDEYLCSDHWTHQLYVREARRMVGEYVATQKDCEGRGEVSDGIAMAAYNMDSHNCERIVIRKDGSLMVKNEGNVEIPGGFPYPVSYGCITPKREECTNLLVPVCLSASHIAYGSIRMEPVFMATGQAAGMAATMAGKGKVQEIEVARLQKILAENPYLDGTQPDIVLDEDSEHIQYEGWTKTPGRVGYGPSYFTLAPGESGSLRYNIPSDLSGKYALYVYQNIGKHIAPLMDYVITVGEQTSTYHFNREQLVVVGQTSGEWVCLGEFEFKPDCNASVSVQAGDPKLKSRTDALLILKK